MGFDGLMNRGGYGYGVVAVMVMVFDDKCDDDYGDNGRWVMMNWVVVIIEK
ncbi:hypothetical protein A2U01_0075731, partial [Trifolium medium]|nr:hypothetical protein [Trifolium medium]